MPIVLFDGVCKFCNNSVNFIIDHDPAGRIQFAALQSATGQRLLKQHGLPPSTLDTLVLVDGRHAYTRSTAALRIAGHMGGWWRYLMAGLLIPPFLRDAVYNLLARNRYRWFGQLDACRMPTPELRQRFLD